IADHRGLYVSRRYFVQGVASAALLAGCGRLPGQAQQPAKLPVVGYLTLNTVVGGTPQAEAVRQGLRDHGYIDGQNITFEARYAEAHEDELPALATALVQLPVDVIVTSGSEVTQAARHATSTIPIIMVTPGDPVREGLVPSLARPDANITGLTYVSNRLAAKRLELLKQIAPEVSRV